MRHFVQLRRGSTATVTALTFTSMLGFLAMSADWGRVYSERAALQSATDAASVAAATLLPDGVAARKAAIAYASNFKVGGYPIMLQPSDVQLGTWDGTSFAITADQDATVVRVSTTVSRSLPVSALFGVGQVPLTAVSGGGAAIGGPSPDLVIVHDVTGSFSQELDDARMATLSLVQCVGSKAPPETKVGAVAFTGYELNLLDPADLLTYETGYVTVYDAVDSLRPCGSAGMPQCSGTNIGAGLWEAKRILDTSDSPPEIGRAAVLISDGLPTPNNGVCEKLNLDDGAGGTMEAYKTEASEALCPSMGHAPSEHNMKQTALDMRDAFVAAGYDLHTVFYNETSSGTASAFMQDLTAGDGIYLESPDPMDLADMLQSVCQAYIARQPGLVF